MDQALEGRKALSADAQGGPARRLQGAEVVDGASFREGGMMTVRAALSIAASVLALLAIVAFSDSLNRDALLGSDGYLTSGARYGVSVGSSVRPALAALEARGFRREPDDTPETCLAQSTGDAHRSATLLYDPRRRAVICLFETDGQVDGIAWAIGGWEF